MIELERDAPDLEDLAAYLDGRLSDERRLRVEERLARDEDYYEVFLESARSLQEEAQKEHGQAEAAGEGGVVVRPAVWWRSWRVIVPVVVAATLVATIGLPRLMLGPSTDEWVARLDAAAVVGWGKNWDDPQWKRSRSGLDPASLRRQELAFRIGTRRVDLRVALAAGRRKAAESAARQLETLTGGDILLPVSAYYAKLREQIDGEEFDALRTRAAELETYLADGFKDTPEARRYALGVWNEAGRLAALAHDTEVLAGLLRHRRVARGIDEIAPHLEKIGTVVDRPDPGEEDFDVAAEAFSQIARALAGRG